MIIYNNPLMPDSDKHRLEDALSNSKQRFDRNNMELSKFSLMAFFFGLMLQIYINFCPVLSSTNMPFFKLSLLNEMSSTFTFFRCFHPNVEFWNPLRASIPNCVLHRLLQLCWRLHHQTHERNHKKGRLWKLLPSLKKVSHQRILKTNIFIALFVGTGYTSDACDMATHYCLPLHYQV